MKRFLLPGLLSLALAGALWLGAGVPGQPAQDAQAVLDAAMDKLGVTQQTAMLTWLETDEQTADVENPLVWIARNGRYVFHSYPLCGGMKAPVEHTLREAEAMGLAPCPKCWEVSDQAD